MKTIDINLIDNISKFRKTSQIVPDGIDDKSKVISVLAVTLSTCIFLLSAGTWSLSLQLTKKAERELAEVTAQQDKLKSELETSQQIVNNLQNEKKILELKSIVQQQIDKDLLPWYRVLAEITRIMPKDIKMTKILKASSRNSDEVVLNIEGETGHMISSNATPIELISFFALNINENPSPLSNLSNAVIKEVKYFEEKKAYTFSMITEIRIPTQEDAKKQAGN